MRPSDVIDLLRDDLIPKFDAELTDLDEIDEWLSGNNPIERPAHTDPNSKRSSLRELSRTPMLRQIVEQLAQQLVLESVSLTSGDDIAARRIWAPFENNGLRSRQGALYEATVGYGYAYSLALPGVTPNGGAKILTPTPDAALITFLSPRQLFVVPSSDPFDEWPMFGLWRIPQAGGSTMYRLFDNEGQHFVSADKAGKLTYIEFRPWGGLDVTPIITYQNHGNLEGESVGEVRRNEIVARRYDATVHDRLLIQHNNSWRILAATGLDDPGSVDEQDRLKARFRHDDVLIGGEGVDFKTLPETTLDSILRAAEADQETLSAMAQVTIWSLNSSKLINLSADALTEARSLNRMKVMALQRSLGRSHANLMRLAAFIEGREEDAANFSLVLEWENVEAQALSGVADALSKLKDLGVPMDALWEMIPGVSRRKVEAWKVWSRQNPTRDQVIASMLARQTAVSDVGE